MGFGDCMDSLLLVRNVATTTAISFRCCRNTAIKNVFLDEKFVRVSVLAMAKLIAFITCSLDQMLDVDWRILPLGSSGSKYATEDTGRC
jgi:hypothetical protein